MGNSIGGDGGGGGGMNFLDPLGLGGIVQGLVGGLGAEIGKLVNGPDRSKIAELGQTLLNKVGSYPDAAGQQAQGGTEQQSGPLTDYQPPAGDGGEAGYSPERLSPTDDQSDLGADATGGSSDGESVAGQGVQQQRGSTSSAATASHDSIGPGEQEAQDELDALQTIVAGGDAFDHYGAMGDQNDGLFNRDSLKNVAKDSNMPEPMRKAAQYLLDHPKLMTQLTIESGRSDGGISLAAIAVHVQAMADGGSRMQGNSGVTNVGQNPSQGARQTSNTQNTSPGPGKTPTGQATAPFPTAQSSDGMTRIGETIDNGIQALQADIEQQAIIVATSHNPTDVAAAQRRISQDTLQLQFLAEQRKAMFELMSNISKTYSDMSLHAIGNIR
jgi:hypothetical protein